MRLLTFILIGLVLGAFESWVALCAVAFFVGFGLGGNIPIDAMIVLEFLPNVRDSKPISPYLLFMFAHRIEGFYSPRCRY